MNSPLDTEIVRRPYPTFATVEQYHQNRPGHSPNPRFIAHTLRTVDDKSAWDIAFHQHKDTTKLGDVVAHQIENPVTVEAPQRTLLLLLAEDIPFDTNLDRWRLAVSQAQHCGTLSDVRAGPNSLFLDQHKAVSNDPERTYRDTDQDETWWQPRVVFHRGVRIETRIKTMQTKEGALTAQDATITITDGQHPRQFSVPVAVLDQVISALGIARDDAEAINLKLHHKRHR